MNRVFVATLPWLAILGLGSCNAFEARSGDLACNLPTDCDAPRVCESGYCVFPAALLPDATVQPDADLSCNAINLVDDFSDDAASPLWTAEPSAGITLVEASGVLTLGIPSLFQPPQKAGYISTASYDMRGHSFFIEIPTMMSTASAGAATLSIRATLIDELQIQQKMGTLSVNLSINDVITTVVAGVPYNATQHRWWRVLEAAGTVRVHTSANGTSWTELGSVATPAFFASVKVALGVRGFGTGSIPGDTVFDNANGGGVVPACP